jgi:hypothetical protein
MICSTTSLTNMGTLLTLVLLAFIDLPKRQDAAKESSTGGCSKQISAMETATKSVPTTLTVSAGSR